MDDIIKTTYWIFGLLMILPVSILIIVIHDMLIIEDGKTDELNSLFPTCDSLKGEQYEKMYLREKDKWLKEYPTTFDILDKMTEECIRNMK